MAARRKPLLAGLVWRFFPQGGCTRPFDRHELHVRLRAGERLSKLQDELLVAGETPRPLVTHEALTTTLNRRTVLERSRRELRRARRGEPAVAVTMKVMLV